MGTWMVAGARRGADGGTSEMSGRGEEVGGRRLRASSGNANLQDQGRDHGRWTCSSTCFSHTPSSRMADQQEERNTVSNRMASIPKQSKWKAHRRKGERRRGGGEGWGEMVAGEGARKGGGEVGGILTWAAVAMLMPSDGRMAMLRNSSPYREEWSVRHREGGDRRPRLFKFSRILAFRTDVVTTSNLRYCVAL